MPKAVFLVFPSRGQWWVDLEGNAEGPFGSRADAIVGAIPLAEAIERTGRKAEVLAPGDDSRHHVAWPEVARRRRA